MFCKNSDSEDLQNILFYMARIIGIDFGRKRIGIAVTDPLGIIATHLQVLRNCDFFEFLSSYLLKEKVDIIVIGLPKDLMNNPSESSVILKPFLVRLFKLYPNLKFSLVDERFTSKIAQQSMLQMGMKKQDRQLKENIDAISAVLILQSFLEQQQNGFVRFVTLEEVNNSLFL